MDQKSNLQQDKSAFPARSQAELEQFVNALFLPDDLVELRLIAARSRVGRHSSPLVERHWLTPNQLLDHSPHLARKNAADTHIYFGVNPRVRASGVKDAVQTCRVIWADIDNVSVENASNHWRSLLPEPSIVVSSGHGVHLYWLLDKPVDVSTLDKRQAFESLLQCLYQLLGADATQDVSRLLRLPGFLNVKSPAAPCRLVSCQAQRRYPLSIFEKWRPKAQDVEHQILRRERFTHSQDTQRIRGLVRYLQTDVNDRSRRDFGVVCGLLRFGLEPEEIWQLVEPHSKFTTAGRAYFENTLKNAIRQIGH